MGATPTPPQLPPKWWVNPTNETEQALARHRDECLSHWIAEHPKNGKAVLEALQARNGKDRIQAIRNRARDLYYLKKSSQYPNR